MEEWPVLVLKLEAIRKGKVLVGVKTQPYLRESGMFPEYWENLVLGAGKRKGDWS